ncbi:MAG: anthranilate phosphoribosyltransferase [Actinomycetota bacterium]
MTDPDLWPRVLTALSHRQSLDGDQAAEAMQAVMQGDATEAQIGAFLLALRTKGETVEEIEGLARTMLDFAVPVRAPEPVIDTCGTGGDRAGTFNISTIAALVVAGAGVPVAKHGNRAATSSCGSADLLEELGVRIDLDAAGVERCLREVGIGFMFARSFHPAMAHAAPVRAELRVPTVFNFLGPLTNPARPYAQVVGVSDERMLPLMAEVLARRGTRAMLFRGVDGLDELTTTDLSAVYDVKDGTVRETHLDPVKLGLGRVKPDDLAGGDAAHNAGIARRILDGEPGPRRDVVLLNAGAALMVAGFASTLDEGMATAARAVDDGEAAKTLLRWVEASNAG